MVWLRYDLRWGYVLAMSVCLSIFFILPFVRKNVCPWDVTGVNIMQPSNIIMWCEAACIDALLVAHEGVTWSAVILVSVSGTPSPCDPIEVY